MSGSVGYAVNIQAGDQMFNYDTIDEWKWHSMSRSVQFYVYDDNDKPILCRVSMEAITDAYEVPATGGDGLYSAKENCGAIIDAVSRKAAKGNLESDGSILLRSGEVLSV